MRAFIEFQLLNTELFNYQIIKWGKKFNKFVLLNSNHDRCRQQLYHKYDLLIGIGSIKSFETFNKNCFEKFRTFNQQHNDWIFGYLTYDLKNELENLDSQNFDGIGMADMLFFIPKYVFIIIGNVLKIDYLSNYSNESEVKKIFYEITNLQVKTKKIKITNSRIGKRFSREEYIKTVNEIKEHIIKGNIYELNLCQEFFIENAIISPEAIYQQLNRISPSPFSGYLRNNNQYLICSSPERFLAKRKSKIISQPIKGTIRRGKDEAEDKKFKLLLELNEKERAENIMIVDLVRNDLSRTAKKGSVRVEELCKIYSFEHVHQMISTVCSDLDEKEFDTIDLLKTTFPMGSMTGAPKIKAMELIEKFEKTRRGLYSGSIGYISPDKDFDFNVVIRSILYNREKKYLSFIAGSAITHQSVAEKEFDECILKSEAMAMALIN